MGADGPLGGLWQGPADESEGQEEHQRLDGDVEARSRLVKHRSIWSGRRSGAVSCG